MQDLITKVERVAQELDQIREELQTPRPADRGIALDILNSFKASVDHMRHVLWAYIEAMNEATGADVDHTLHQYRMQRATEMLRQLREQGPLGTGTPQENSFLREVQAIADGALKRYSKPPR